MNKEKNVEAFLIKQIKQRSDVTCVEKDKSLEDNGVDSLDKVEIAMEIEKEYHIEFPEYILYSEMKTVSDWLEFIEFEIKK